MRAPLSQPTGWVDVNRLVVARVVGNQSSDQRQASQASEDGATAERARRSRGNGNSRSRLFSDDNRATSESSGRSERSNGNESGELFHICLHNLVWRLVTRYHNASRLVRLNLGQLSMTLARSR